jgi:hypothetical protein
LSIASPAFCSALLPARFLSRFKTCPWVLTETAKRPSTTAPQKFFITSWVNANESYKNPALRRFSKDWMPDGAQKKADEPPFLAKKYR